MVEGTTVDGSSEPSTINAGEMEYVTLAAEADVADLPAPVTNRVVQQAKLAARRFAAAVGADDAHVTVTDGAPRERDTVGAEVTVDVSEADVSRRIGVYTAARAHESRFMGAVERARDRLGE
jgi:hypothetical protein